MGVYKSFINTSYKFNLNGNGNNNGFENSVSIRMNGWRCEEKR